MIPTGHWEEPKKQRPRKEKPLYVAKATLRLGTLPGPSPSGLLEASLCLGRRTPPEFGVSVSMSSGC